MDIIGIKSGILQKSIRMDIRVEGKKVGKYGFQGRDVANGLILVMGSDFFSWGISGWAVLTPSFGKGYIGQFPAY